MQQIVIYNVENSEQKHNLITCLKEVCFILSDNDKSFLIMKDKQVKTIKYPQKTLLEVINEKEEFIKINKNTIINNSYFIAIEDKKKRFILMKTGNILKVSRKKWDYFKLI